MTIHKPSAPGPDRDSRHRTSSSDDDTSRRADTYAHDLLTHRIIGCALEVHRVLGTSLLEHTYENALCLELAKERIPFVRQAAVPVFYKGHLLGEHRPDLVVQDTVVVEVKSVERLVGLHQAQVLAYMRSLKMPV